MRRKKHITGFTLVELMIAAVLLVIIMAAIVPQFRAIRNSWATNEESSAIIQNAMVLDEHINRNLAMAKEIKSVSADTVTSGFITFLDNDGNSQTYKVSSNYILFGETGSEQQLVGPVSKFQITCYSLDDLDTPTTDVNNIRLIRIATNITSDDSAKNKSFTSEVFIYAGKQVVSDQNVIDIMVNSSQADTAFDYTSGDNGCDAVIDIGTSSSGGGGGGRGGRGGYSNTEIHGLLWFKDIVGDTNGQVPEGTEITEAKLQLWYVNHNDDSDVYIYRMNMNVPWTETSTWNSIGGGVNPGSNCDSASVITANLDPATIPTTVEIDVTEIVQGWINGDYDNYGFGIVNDSTNNLQFAATENTTGTDAHTPKLVVKYEPSGNDPKVAVQNYVSYGGSSGTFDSYNSGSGSYGGSNVSYNAVVTANAIGSGIITLYSGGIIYGDAYIGPDGDISTGFSTWGSTITGTRGTLDEELDFTTPAAPTGSPFSGSNEGDYPTDAWKGGERTINSNRHFNSISLTSSNTYITITGDITILLDGNLNVNSNNSIRIASDSSLKLYVKGACSIGGSLNAYNECLPSNLRIYMLGSNKTFSTWGSGSIYALIDNPNGPISFWGSGQFYGRLKANYLTGGCKVHVDLDSNFNGDTVLFEDGFETSFDKWTTDWERDNTEQNSGSYSACADENSGNLTSDNINTSTHSSFTVHFKYRENIQKGEVKLQFYNGSSYKDIEKDGKVVNLNDTSSEDEWYPFTYSVTDSQYCISNFSIRFSPDFDGSNKKIYIDDVKVSAGVSSEESQTWTFGQDASSGEILP